MGDLPNEILSMILGLIIHANDLNNCCLVNKRFYQIIKSSIDVLSVSKNGKWTDVKVSVNYLKRYPNLEYIFGEISTKSIDDLIFFQKIRYAIFNYPNVIQGALHILKNINLSNLHMIIILNDNSMVSFEGKELRVSTYSNDGLIELIKLYAQKVELETFKLDRIPFNEEIISELRRANLKKLESNQFPGVKIFEFIEEFRPYYKKDVSIINFQELLLSRRVFPKVRVFDIPLPTLVVIPLSLIFPNLEELSILDITEDQVLKAFGVDDQLIQLPASKEFGRQLRPYFKNLKVLKIMEEKVYLD